MRQAGRYLPEYREVRSRYSFEEAIHRPEVATEITLQPLRRFPLDAAIVFADIMTPLTALGVDIDFDPGPRLTPLTVDRIARMGELDTGRLDFVAETIARARASLDREVAVIGFAGGPITLLAYLLGGKGTGQFVGLRRALHRGGVEEALAVLAQAMQAYLRFQIEGGADVVQLFDTWAGLLSVDQFEEWAVPAARRALTGLSAPSIYFTTRASHLLGRLHLVGATGYGVDWRLPLGKAWRRVGVGYPVQGNLDPAVLLGDRETVRRATRWVLEEAGGRPGHIFTLGHGVHSETPVTNVEAMVEAVVGWEGPTGAGAPSALNHVR